MVRVGSWFAGIGGFDLGFELAGGYETAFFVEKSPFCRGILAQHWPGIPLFGALEDLEAHQLPEADLWAGGFPCQPFSLSGSQDGHHDPRNLWPLWYERFVAVLRPRRLLLENVPGLIFLHGGRVFGGILADLAASGYDAEWTIIAARDVGAPHRRGRLFVYAEQQEPAAPMEQRPRADLPMVNTDRQRLEKQRRALATRAPQHRPQRAGRIDWPDGWALDPATRHLQAETRAPAGCLSCGGTYGKAPSMLDRMAHGIPDRVDRIRALGNAVAPHVIAWIACRIKDRITQESTR